MDWNICGETKNLKPVKTEKTTNKKIQLTKIPKTNIQGTGEGGGKINSSETKINLKLNDLNTTKL